MSAVNAHSEIRNPKSEIIRVLLIEDSPGYAEIVKIMLDKIADARFDVVCARRLLEGLQCLSTGEIDVVLLDLKLPDSQGIDTFDRVYAQAPRVPVIVLTVTDNDAMAVGAVKKGAQDYLVKDQVDVKLLVQAIRYAIERKRVEEDLKDTGRGSASRAGRRSRWRAAPGGPGGPLLLEQLPHVVGEAGDAEEAGLLVEEGVDLLEATSPPCGAGTRGWRGRCCPPRVPITRPSSGVRPIEVLTDSPFLIAQAEQPLPRCTVMMFVSSYDFPVRIR